MNPPTAPAPSIAAARATAVEERSATVRPSNAGAATAVWREAAGGGDYSYVIRDLVRIGILALVLIGGMVLISFAINR